MSELQHPDARSFEDVAELYERVRPEYPKEAIDWLVDRLGLTRGSTVVDLGAGTGKLTRLLVRRVGRVIAVEPGPKMLAQLERSVPEADGVLGAAEAIPLGDACVDAVVCAQSFHWFRAAEALQEIHRVVRRGGGLGLIWNHRHPDDGLQNDLRVLLEPYIPFGRPRTARVLEEIVRDSRFGEIEAMEFEFAVDLDPDGVAARIASISYVAAAPPEAQRQLAESVRELVADSGGVVPFRYLTEVYVTLVV